MKRNKNGDQNSIKNFLEKIRRKLADVFYSLDVKINLNFKKKKKVVKSGNGNARVFYAVMIALPLLQFCIFYIGVNFNSILLAFKQIFPEVKGESVVYVQKFVGFDNFNKFITVELQSITYKIAITNSVKYLLFSIFIVIPCGLVFSFYIFRKYPLSSMYRIFLFLPSVICSLILVIFYQYLADLSIPELIVRMSEKRISGLLTTKNTAFFTLVFFNFWFSFGPSSLVYVNAMTQIDPSAIEAAEIDGATGIKQFFHIVLPMIFPSITSYIIICIAQVASNQLSGYSFFGSSASDYGVQTIGYKLFQIVADDTTTQAYPLAAAAGILFTLIVAPLTLLIQTLLKKFGPSEE